MATLYSTRADRAVSAPIARLVAALPSEWEWLVGATVEDVSIPHFILTPHGIGIVVTTAEHSTPDEWLELVDLVAALTQRVATYLQQPDIAAQIWQEIRMARLVAPVGIVLTPSHDFIDRVTTLVAWEDAPTRLPALFTGNGTLDLAREEQIALRMVLMGATMPLKPTDSLTSVPSVSRLSFLDKAKKWWRRFTHASESWEEILTGTGFATLKYNAMEQTLLEVLHATLLDLPHETIAHNAFTLFWSEEDGKRYEPYRERITAHLTAFIERQVRQNRWQTEGAICIEVRIDPALAAGDCRALSNVQLAPLTGMDRLIARGSTPHLEVTANDSAFVLNRTVTTLGRDPECHLILQPFDPDNITSRRHARIQLEAGHFVLYDGTQTEPSFAGTYLNGTKVQPGQGIPLKSGDRIILGPPQRFDPQKPMEGSLLLIYREQS